MGRVFKSFSWPWNELSILALFSYEAMTWSGISPITHVLSLSLLYSFKSLFFFYPNKDAQTQKETVFGNQLHSLHKPKQGGD